MYRVACPLPSNPSGGEGYGYLGELSLTVPIVPQPYQPTWRLNMKRLFCVKNRHGKRVDNPRTRTPWFDNKMEAKKLRDSLFDMPPYRIARGPDHRHGET